MNRLIAYDASSGADAALHDLKRLAFRQKPKGVVLYCRQRLGSMFDLFLAPLIGP
jgi:hypothetical protein